jgi:hypothetical protein
VHDDKQVLPGDGRAGWRGELSSTTGSERTICEVWGELPGEVDIENWMLIKIKMGRTMTKK